MKPAVPRTVTRRHARDAKDGRSDISPPNRAGSPGGVPIPRPRRRTRLPSPAGATTQFPRRSRLVRPAHAPQGPVEVQMSCLRLRHLAVEIPARRWPGNTSGPWSRRSRSPPVPAPWRGRPPPKEISRHRDRTGGVAPSGARVRSASGSDTMPGRCLAVTPPTTRCSPCQKTMWPALQLKEPGTRPLAPEPRCLARERSDTAAGRAKGASRAKRGREGGNGTGSDRVTRGNRRRFGMHRHHLSAFRSDVLKLEAEILCWSRNMATACLLPRYVEVFGPNYAIRTGGP